MGVEKCLWVEEVHKKFNVLSLFNYLFRECIDSFFNQDKDHVEIKKKEKITVPSYVSKS
jgi:hypothetical protein